MILLYRVLSVLFYPILIILIFVRKFLKKEHPTRYKEKILSSNFNIQRKKRDSKLLWFHAASIGELNSIVPIIDELKKKGNLEFLITTVTLSSNNLANKIFNNQEKIHHRFFPVDSFFLMKKFLRSWNPSVIFLVDSEIWPNLILKAKAKRIPIALINARITKKSFNRWSIFPGAAKKVFNLIKLSLCSNQETESFLKKLDVKNVKCEGNIKFSNKIELKDLNDRNKKRGAKSPSKFRKEFSFIS